MTDQPAARILDGKRIAEDLLDSLKLQVDTRVAAGKRRPGLAVVLVGGDPASQSYVRNKRRAAQKVGIRDLRQSALLKVRNGITSLAEINRVTKD